MVERVVEGLPEADLVASLDLVEEAIDSGDGLALVVASQDDYLPWESDLQSVKKADDLTRLLATVYVIAHEEVAGLHRDDFVALELVLVLLLHLFEHVQQVGVLPVDVAEDLDRCFKLD